MTGQVVDTRNSTFDWNGYGLGVMSGEILVSRWTRLAVERHYRDLADGHERGLWFSDDHAQHALESLLYLRHSKGEWDGQGFVPSLWQQFWVALAFGWLRADGTRRFRRVWLEVPRKNGKTTLLAGIGLYLFYFDNEGGAEVYTAATKLDQAKLCHDEAVRMVNKSPLLRRHIANRRSELFLPGTACKFVPLGRDSKTMDGFNPHGAILDEVHAHPDAGIYEVIKSGLGARRQPMIWKITTAGENLAGFGYAQHRLAKKLLDGVIADDDFLAVIYTVDDPEKWSEPDEWAKANPNIGVSVKSDVLQRDVHSAVNDMTEQPNFKRKNLNIWLAGGESWIPGTEWRACADKNLRLEDFRGLPCFGGLDLAEKGDIAALVWIFPHSGKYYVFCRFYHNRFTVEKKENEHLRRFEALGELIVNEGNATDFDVIRADIEAFAEDFDLQELAFDPKFGIYFVKKLLDKGLPMVEISQTSSNFTAPVTEVANLVLTREIVHDGNSLMAWMMSNVLLRISKFSGLKHPTKEADAEKIDGPVAMLNGMARALAGDPPSRLDDFLNNPISTG